MFSPAERRYLDAARLGRLATVDDDGRPHVVPVCFALVDDEVVTPIDEKPKDAPPTDLQRVRNVRENPHVALVVDHWREDWDELGWVQVRGRAELVDSGVAGHDAAVSALRAKYDQYTGHALEDRPAIRIGPAHVVSWGQLG